MEESHRLLTLALQISPTSLSSALSYATRAHTIAPSIETAALVTACKILSDAATSTTNHYRILQTQLFANTTVVKKQYRKLALTLHPDKNPFAACEEAFKLVAEAWSVLSDRVRRKEYDTGLRLAMQAEATEEDDAAAEEDKFWTACGECRSVHRFERRYLGHCLMCPGCRKSFRALEVGYENGDGGDKVDGIGSSSNGIIRAKRAGLKRKTTSVGEVLKRSMLSNDELSSENRDGDDDDDDGKKNVVGYTGGGSRRKKNSVGKVLELSMFVNREEGDDSGVSRSRRGVNRRVSSESKLKRVGNDEEEVTLAEVLRRSMPAKGEVGSDNRKLRWERGVVTRVSGESELKRAGNDEDEITLAEVLGKSMSENGEVGSDNKVLRSKRGMRTRVSDESKSNREKIEEEGITLMEVLGRSMPANGESGSDARKFRSKRGVHARVSDESKSKRAEIVEEESTLAEMLGRSVPANGKLGSDNLVSMPKRRVGRRVLGESKSNMEGIEEGVTLVEVLDKSNAGNGELGSDNRVLRLKTTKTGVLLDEKGVGTRALDEYKSKRVETAEEESMSEVLERSIPANGELGSNDRVLRSKRGVGTRVSNDSQSKMGNIVEEGITLAEMQMLANKKVREEKMRLRVNEKREEGKKAKECREDKQRRRVSSEDEDLEIMAVEDSDFYDFDKERVERSFKKGQVWAVYDDDDGMPRHYGLIDQVSVYPFKIRLIWLEPESRANEVLLSWDKTGVRISCGRFKLAKMSVIDSVNIFSHYVDAERAAREVYRIYPKKGSVWALFNENTSPNRDKRCYDIIVCLTSYDETYGLSMAYLEKVDGLKTVFKRREIGCHAIRLLEKADFRLFSHQIPARKLCGKEALELSKDCWELDPASLSPELLRIG